MDARTAAWTLVALVLVVTPGADFAVVFRNALRGRAVGFATSAGTIAGVTIHCTAAVLGVSAILAASAMAFTVFKVAGGLYLCWLGLTALRRAGHVAAARREDRVATTPAKAFGQGLLTNVLNPKAALICASLLPQFVPPGAPVLSRTLLLSAILLAVAAAWYFALVALVHTLRPFLTRGAVRRVMDRVTGVVLVAFGVRLLLERRPTPAS